MCGIAGILDFSGNSHALHEVVEFMSKTLAHRGPDDQGFWADETVNLTISHRRLSILDLSKEGHQPMISHGGRYVIAFNGEIYNHDKLRKHIPNITWRGTSDTETLLEYIAHFGMQTTLENIAGMFAFVVWDRYDKKLSLIRDRLGEKPLYYVIQNQKLFFASELKAIVACNIFKSEIDKQSVADYFRLGYVPAPYSIYSEVYKLLPGSFIEFDLKNKKLSQVKKYWEAKNIAIKGLAKRKSVNAKSVEDNCLDILRKIVSEQKIADVPLGTFLSGGVDSTLITALLVEQSGSPVQTFTVGFFEKDYDEAIYAESVAKYLGTNHTNYYITAKDVESLIPKIPLIYDEPFADSSQIPTQLLCQYARNRVTVALTGDGGDEVFGGYNRYIYGRKMWQIMKWIPESIRQVAANALLNKTPQQWEKIYHLFIKNHRSSMFGVKLHKVANAFKLKSSEDMYASFISNVDNPQEICHIQSRQDQWRELWGINEMEFVDKMQLADSITYLPDDILVKVDRAAMSVGFETRAPFLDYRIFDFAWQIPLSLKLNGSTGKILLRKLLKRYIPTSLMDRPKQGFGLPVGEWLRGSLRDWAEDLLNKERLSSDELFYNSKIYEKWNEHIAGHRNHQNLLWSFLMFQSWRLANKVNI